MSKGFLFSVSISAIIFDNFISFFGPKIQSYFALISARINNAQIIMTCPGFDRSWLYRELDKFYMRETDINEHFLAAVLQIFSNSADPARFLPPIYHQVSLAGSVWFLTPICWQRMSNRFCQISNDNVATSFDITDFVWDLLLFCYQKLIACSAQNLSLQVYLSG